MIAAARVKLRSWAPVQIAVLALGLWWIGNGIAVFCALGVGEAALSTNGAVDALGVSIAVNGWHGLFHLASGVAGVAASPSPAAARIYALAVGMLYLAAALCALFMGSTVFGLLHVDQLGSADHALEGLLLLSLWLI